MSESMNQQVLLDSRPTGEPTENNFAFVETVIPGPEQGEVLSRTIYLSLDPYMRGRMIDRESYATPIELGKVMGGSTVSQVIKSNHAQFSEEEFVLGYDGWQAYGIAKGEALRKLENAPHTFMGLLQGKNFGKLIVQVGDDPTKA
jgi:NADPH-dependent curcumin reductase